jgi:hypothetical protein
VHVKGGAWLTFHCQRSQEMIELLTKAERNGDDLRWIVLLSVSVVGDFRPVCLYLLSSCSTMLRSPAKRWTGTVGR